MDFHTEELNAQPIVFIRTPTKMNEIGDKIGQCLGQIGPAVGPNAAGMPLVRYLEWNEEGGVMEVAMPVKAPTTVPTKRTTKRLAEVTVSPPPSRLRR